MYIAKQRINKLQGKKPSKTLCKNNTCFHYIFICFQNFVDLQVYLRRRVRSDGGSRYTEDFTQSKGNVRSYARRIDNDWWVIKIAIQSATRNPCALRRSPHGLLCICASRNALNRGGKTEVTLYALIRPSPVGGRLTGIRSVTVSRPARPVRAGSVSGPSGSRALGRYRHRRRRARLSSSSRQRGAW